MADPKKTEEKNNHSSTNAAYGISDAIGSFPTSLTPSAAAASFLSGPDASVCSVDSSEHYMGSACVMPRPHPVARLSRGSMHVDPIRPCGALDCTGYSSGMPWRVNSLFGC